MLRGIRDRNSIAELLHKLKSKNVTSLSILLAIEQARRHGYDALDSDQIKNLCGGLDFSRDEILLLDKQIDNVKIYKRASLPMECHSCGSRIFSYHNYRCVCGVKIFDHADSMAIIVIKR